MSKYDKVLFYQNDENCKLRGLIVCHVDDFRYGVTDDFEREVSVKLEKRIKISSKEALQLNYLRLIIEQTHQNNAIDQNNYVKLLEVVKPTADLVKRDVFTSEDLRELRRAIGQLMWVTSQSRSDVATETSNALAEKALTVEIAVLREHCEKCIDVIWLETRKQIADPLTKAGARSSSVHISLGPGKWIIRVYHVMLKEKRKRRLLFIVLGVINPCHLPPRKSC